MPIRVKPVHDLGPCLLDLDSIKGICALADKELNYAFYSASDGVWEIYDEDSASFLAAISDHDKLDSFYVEAPFLQARQLSREALGMAAERKVKLFFDKEQARVTFELSPTHLEWVDHFMLDLKRHIRSRRALESPGDIVRFLLTILAASSARPFARPNADAVEKALIGDYTRIVLKKKEPNPTVRSIRDNLASNLIYDVLKVAFGIILALVALWIFNRYGVNINEWFTPLSIPTPTPSP